MKNSVLLINIFIFVLLSSVLMSCSRDTLDIGDIAPDFNLENQENDEIRLSNYKGKFVILVFYGRTDNNSTIEHLTNIESDYSKYIGLGAAVIGINHEREEIIRNVHRRLRLSFDLLSDREKKTIKAYRVSGGFGSAKRVTFIIDPSGIIRSVIEEDDTEDHRQEILNELRNLTQGG
ncbi:MAG: redoxin domain-containing protein [Bacteroidota bacterium]